MNAIRILPATGHRSMAWKNGGGTTHEVAIAPASATLADFDWRVSLADVASDGPFSAFPGITRSLAILTGAGVQLSAPGWTAQLTADDAPLQFDGGVPITSTLIAGPVRDLNVMTREGRFTHTLDRLAPRAIWGDATSVMISAGTWRLQIDNDAALTLAPFDAVIGGPAPVPRRLILQAAAAPVYWITLTPLISASQ